MLWAQCRSGEVREHRKPFLTEGATTLLHMHQQLTSPLSPLLSSIRIEGSKAWSKGFMSRHNIPTAHYATFSDLDSASQYVQQVIHR